MERKLTTLPAFPARSRSLYLCLILAVIASGLATRRYPGAFPPFVAAYAGDTLWALTAFLGAGFLFPSFSPPRVAVFALAFAYGIEFSQLYHAPWIDALRHTRPGGLILGFGFLRSDLVCYTVGVATGLLLEVLVRKPARRR